MVVRDMIIQRNPWGGISADVERKILYVSTGNAGRFYEGTTRPGTTNIPIQS